MLLAHAVVDLGLQNKSANEEK
uniref:Uncharacterized protein n=1 Tax=Anguilla anguilla TaxID=7936 RepID=A0A0E9QKM6_ANGAN